MSLLLAESLLVFYSDSECHISLGYAFVGLVSGGNPFLVWLPMTCLIPLPLTCLIPTVLASRPMVSWLFVWRVGLRRVAYLASSLFAWRVYSSYALISWDLVKVSSVDWSMDDVVLIFIYPADVALSLIYSYNKSCGSFVFNWEMMSLESPSEKLWTKDLVHMMYWTDQVNSIFRFYR